MRADVQSVSEDGKVLIVSHDLHFRIELLQSFRESGYSLLWQANSGNEAIALLRQTVTADLIVVDVADDADSIFVLCDWLMRSLPLPPVLVGLMRGKASSLANLAANRVDLLLKEPIATSEIVAASQDVLLSRQEILKVKLERGLAGGNANGVDSHESMAHKISESVTPVLKEFLARNRLSRQEIRRLEEAFNALGRESSLETTSSNAALTPMERQVYFAVQAGKSAKEIATELAISSTTVYSHMQSIRKKMGLTNVGSSLRTVLAKTPLRAKRTSSARKRRSKKYHR